LGICEQEIDVASKSKKYASYVLDLIAGHNNCDQTEKSVACAIMLPKPIQGPNGPEEESG